LHGPSRSRLAPMLLRSGVVEKNAQRFRPEIALVIALVLAPEATAGRATRPTPIGRATALASSDPSCKVRLQAIVTLAELGDRRAVGALRRILADPEPLVRALAASALGQLCTGEGVGALDALARDERHSLARRQAFRAARSCRRTLAGRRRWSRSGRVELADAAVDPPAGPSRAGEQELE